MALGKEKFLIIGITTPQPEPDIALEAENISRFLTSHAVDFFHLRKPDSPEDYVADLMTLIPSNLHKQIVLHSHFGLAKRFDFGGIHLKGDNVLKEGCFYSNSCHSFQELQDTRNDELKYSFISPIYNSISKPGYKAAFDINSPEFSLAIERMNAIALGGVTPENFDELLTLKFVGAALLGYLWSPNLSIDNKIKVILNKRNNLI